MERLAEQDPGIERLRRGEQSFFRVPGNLASYRMRERMETDHRNAFRYVAAEARSEGIAEGEAKGRAEGEGVGEVRAVPRVRRRVVPRVRRRAVPRRRGTCCEWVLRSPKLRRRRACLLRRSRR